MEHLGQIKIQSQEILPRVTCHGCFNRSRLPWRHWKEMLRKKRKRRFGIGIMGLWKPPKSDMEPEHDGFHWWNLLLQEPFLKGSIVVFVVVFFKPPHIPVAFGDGSILKFWWWEGFFKIILYKNIEFEHSSSVKWCENHDVRSSDSFYRAGGYGESTLFQGLLQFQGSINFHRCHGPKNDAKTDPNNAIPWCKLHLFEPFWDYTFIGNNNHLPSLKLS